MCANRGGDSFEGARTGSMIVFWGTSRSTNGDRSIDPTYKEPGKRTAGKAARHGKEKWVSVNKRLGSFGNNKTLSLKPLLLSGRIGAETSSRQLNRYSTVATVVEHPASA